MNKKLLFSIIAIAFAGGLFSAAYAGPILTMITLAGDVIITGDTTLQGDLVCIDCIDSVDIADGVLTAHPQIPRPNSVTTLDSSGTVGQFTSITIGTDGLPIISYNDSSNGNLKIAHCGNATCTSGNTAVTLAGSFSQATFTSIAIHTDGFPIISYIDGVTGDLMVFDCGSINCISGINTLNLVDPDARGFFTSITIDPDGRPIISYYDGDLKVAYCAHPKCASGIIISILDSQGIVGRYSSITIGTDGLPIISYQDVDDDDLKVAHCENKTCDSGNTAVIFESVGDVGEYSSITIGTDGLPIISYYDRGNGDLRVGHCANRICTAGTAVAVDSLGDVGKYSSITIGTDGLPVISYYDSSNGNLKIAHCGNVTCTSGNTAFIVDSIFNVGQHSAITIGTDGLPFISYYDVDNGDLKVAHCGNEFCIPNWTRR